ncbi:MFS transporter [Desulfovibrio sp. OttesenSCG-928-C06]|nr:MFS transporter [Desulfovibrio sp. OttesenSCG-928-C06]
MPFDEDKLFNRNYILVCLCNFLFACSFNLILPVLPLYLTDGLGASKSVMGIVMACYALAALIMRPFSGWLVDGLQRKFVFILCMIPFLLCTVSYVFIMQLFLIGCMRFMHGLAYGAAGTSISTIAVDNIPVRKLGTGIGLFGITVSLSMAVGPMLGMILVDYFPFNQVFMFCFGIACLSFLIGMLIRMPRREIQPRQGGIKFDDFFLKSGVTAFCSLIMAAFPYGLMLNFISLYTREHNFDINAGLYFSVLSIGLVTSRLFSGKLMDRGYVSQVIIGGKICGVLAFCLFILAHDVMAFFASAIILGLGYGMLSPAYQTMFILLADENHRGTANSTYFIAWDLSVGISVIIGGLIADWTNLDVTFWCGTGLLVLSIIFFRLVAFRKYKEHHPD